MTMREANRSKKYFGCLKCGRKMYTDRCHRICPKCHQKNSKEGRIRQAAVMTYSGHGERLGTFDDMSPTFSDN
jgi:uncharacterized OB-fold protein